MPDVARFSPFSVSFVVLFSRSWRTLRLRCTPVAHDRKKLLQMRTRQKLTAAGAIALATAAVVGGAAVTSHAMADSPVPEKGTLTIVSATNGSDPIKCVYDDVDLPTPPAGAGEPHFSTGTPSEAGAVLNIVTGSGPAPDGAPTVISGSAQAEGPIKTGPGAVASGGISVSTGDGQPHLAVSGDGDGLPPLPPPGADVIDLSDARVGTADECAALRSTTALPGSTTAP